MNSENITRIRKLLRSDRVPWFNRSLVPDLAVRKEVSVGRAYDEYCRRVESGEDVDRDAFCNDHVEFRSALYRRIELHHYLDDNPDTLDYLEPIPWPDVGDTFGDCLLIEELGFGGAGRVFLASENGLSRKIVLKLVAGDNGEAERLCRLDHPSIVPIYYVRHDPKTQITAIGMPFESRYTLSDFLDAAARGPAAARFGDVFERLFPEESSKSGDDQRMRELSFVDGVLQIGYQLAKALRHSHEAGIYHLDLKPSNVLVRADGSPRLIDFNLSVLADNDEEVLGGTKPYMSPEQLHGLIFQLSTESHQVDGRSDVYSLAVMLCQLLTGQHPFGSLSWKGTEEQLRLRQLDWQPGELNRFERINKKTARLLADCLAVDPSDRIDSAELVKRLEKLVETDRKTGRRYFVAATSAVVLALAARPLFEPGAESLRASAHAEFAAGQYADAIRTSTAYLELVPDDPEILSLRARAILRQDKPDAHHQALPDYRLAHQVSGDAAYLAGVGFCEYLSGNHERAASNLKLAIEGGFGTAETHNLLALCYLHPHYFGKAKSHFSTAIQLKPELRSALYYRAYCKLRMSKYPSSAVDPSARDDIESALKLGEPTGKMYFHAACILDGLPSKDAGTVETTLAYIDEALDRGATSKTILSGPNFPELRQSDAFKRILDRPRTTLDVPDLELPNPLDVTEEVRLSKS